MKQGRRFTVVSERERERERSALKGEHVYMRLEPCLRSSHFAEVRRLCLQLVSISGHALCNVDLT
jgi:hypothetical protein